MVAMNSQTYAEDIADVHPGGYVLYDSSWPLDTDLKRDDVTFLGVPLATMCLENFQKPRERILMKNIAYAGCGRGARGRGPRHRRRPARRDLRRATKRCATPTSGLCDWAMTTRSRTSSCPLEFASSR